MQTECIRLANVSHKYRASYEVINLLIFDMYKLTINYQLQTIEQLGNSANTPGATDHGQYGCKLSPLHSYCGNRLFSDELTES